MSTLAIFLMMSHDQLEFTLENILNSLAILHESIQTKIFIPNNI